MIKALLINGIQRVRLKSLSFNILNHKRNQTIKLIQKIKWNGIENMVILNVWSKSLLLLALVCETNLKLML